MLGNQNTPGKSQRFKQCTEQTRKGRHSNLFLPLRYHRFFVCESPVKQKHQANDNIHTSVALYHDKISCDARLHEMTNRLRTMGGPPRGLMGGPGPGPLPGPIL